MALAPLTPDAYLNHLGHACHAATVSGPAEALFLLLWHRIDLGDPRLTVAGSRATAAAVLAAALTP